MKTSDKALILSCAKLLIKQRLTIAFAESATAGRICAEFSLVPDAGKFLKGGIACYDANLKESLLGVPGKQLKAFTPESPIVTCSITAGLQKLIQADIHVGCTGLTCPGGSETPEKPVGTMFLYGIRGDKLLFDEQLFYPGTQEDIVRNTVADTARLLIRHLSKK